MRSESGIEEKAREVAALFHALANEKRLLVLCALADGPLEVHEIAESMPEMSKSGLSQHLAALRQAGLVMSEKHGLYVTYSVADDKVLRLLETVKREFCE